MPNEIYHRSNWGESKAEDFGDVYYDHAATNKLYNHSDYYENSDGTDATLKDLNNKASIVLTPTAYSDGSLNTVIPPYQVLPTELVTNGTFDTDSSWSKTNATISDGKATITVVGGAYSLIGQSLTYQSGKMYKLTAQVQGTNGKACTFFDNGSNIGGLGSSNGVINFDGNLQDVNITFTANSNSNQLLIVRNGSGDYTFTVDNVSVKEIQEADFDFSRGSSATRVNEQGLVEDVQILSGELVQNGNFEQIGSELVTNGNFDTDSDWIKETGWTISDGKANKTNTVASNFAQLNTGVFTNNNIYKITFTISNSNDGRLLIYIGGNSATIDITNATNGTHTFYGKADGQNYLIFRNVASGFQGSIDNVSVKEVGQNWTFGTGWSMGDGKVIADGTMTASDTLNQSYNFTDGNKYRFKFTVSDYQSGSVYIREPFNGGADAVSANGTFTFDYIAGSANEIRFRSDNGFIGSLDNVSYKEVTDDTDLPRIDFTDGTGSLLLEPQRTNLVPYSEDFSQWLNNTSNLDVPSNVTQTNPSGGSESGFINVNNGVSATKFIYESISTTSNIHTQSVFFKYHSRQWIQLLSGGTSHYANFDIQNGVVGNVSGCTATIKDYGSGWYRCTATLSSAGTPINFVIAVIDDDATSRLPVSTGTGSYYVWGAQTEVGDYATSYIVSNSGSATTRSADVANNSGNADLFNDSEGVLYAQFTALADDNTSRTVSINNTSSNRVFLSLRATTGQVNSGVVVGGVLQGSAMFDTVSQTSDIKLAIKYKQNDFSLFVNGTQASTSSGNVFSSGTLNNLSFDSGSGAEDFFGKVKCVAVFKEALSNDLLERLTGEGYESFRLLAEANNYTII